MANSNYIPQFTNGLQIDTETAEVSPVYGSGANEIAQGNDNRFKTAKRLIVKVSDAGADEFTDIQTAIDSITDASITNPYHVEIGPGVYNISDSIVMKPFVYVTGQCNSTLINITDETKPVIIGAFASTIAECSLSGSGISGTDVALIEFSGGAVPSFPFRVSMVNFRDCHSFVKVSVASSNFGVMALNNITVDSAQTTYGFRVEGAGQGVLLLQNCSVQFSQPGNNLSAFLFATGSLNRLIANNCSAIIIGGANGENYARVENGATFNGQTNGVDGFNEALYVPNIGSAVTLGVASLSIINSTTYDVNLGTTSTVGWVTGAWSLDKVVKPTGSNVTLTFTDDDPLTRRFVNFGDIYQGLETDSVINVSRLTRKGTFLGLLEGGELTKNATAFDLDIAAGEGFIDGTSGFVEQVFWDAITLTVPANATEYVTVNDVGLVQLEPSLPADYEDRIILGRVATNGTDIILIEETAVSMYHQGNKVERLLREALGTLFTSGVIVTENVTTDRNFDVTSGDFYFGSNKFLAPARTGGNFKRFYRNGSGGYTIESSQTQIPNNLYDNNLGTLSSVPAGEFVKHLIFIVPQGGGAAEYNVLIGQTPYSTLGEAVDGSVPPLPFQLIDASVVIAQVITQEGQANFQQIIDARPRIGFSSASTASVSDHGNLLGLGDDDHLQYLRTDGGRALTGDLDLGGNDIVNVGSIPGITTAPPVTLTPDQPNTEGVSTAKARADHVHNVPCEPAVGLDANSSSLEGTNASFARSDHTHEISAGVVSTQNPGQINTEGTSLNFARADHAHEIPTASAVALVPDAANAEGTSTSFARADHVHNIAADTASGLDAASNNTEGVSTSFARADHTHALSTGVVSTQNPDQLNAEGVSANLARADHVHNIPTDTAVTLNPDQANAEGTSTSFARADHVHNVPADVAVTLGANSTNTEGNSISFSRANHTHDLSTGAVITQIPDQLNAEGVSDNLARADHVHNIATDTASQLTPELGNSEGVSNSFARADHIHNIPSGAATTLGANSTNTEGTAAAFARTDHTHDINTGVVSTQTPDQANAEGVSDNLARADHIHNIATDAPNTNLTGDTVNTEGISTSFARSDHYHAVDTGNVSTQNAGQVNSEGVSPNLARADHSHEIPTAAAVTLGANSTNTEGASTSFSRADHTHDLNTGIVSTLNPDQANSEGASDNLARADHIHNVPTDVAVNVSDTNAEGVSTSFARADHTHDVFPVLSAEFAENNAIQTTNSGTPQLGLNLTTSSLPLGTYKIEWTTRLSIDSTSRNAEAQVQLNNLETLSGVQFSPPTVTNGITFSGFAIRTLSGVQSIDLDYFRSGGGGATAAVQYTRLSIMRIA